MGHLKRAIRGERGFTLIELLVVMIVLALLAAIAVPAFLSQTDKARDAEAKQQLTTAQRAIETYSVGNDGRYTGADVPSLHQIEESLDTTMLAVSANAGDYELSFVSASGTTFGLARDDSGSIERTCAPAGDGGCSSAGGW